MLRKAEAKKVTQNSSLLTSSIVPFSTKMADANRAAISKIDSKIRIATN
jgi:hypothetical protein